MESFGLTFLSILVKLWWLNWFFTEGIGYWTSILMKCVS